MKSGWDFSCSFHLGHEIFDALPVPCIAGFKETEKLIGKLVLDGKYIYLSEHF